MELRASHGQSPKRPNRVLCASCLPRTTRPHERTLGHRGRFAAPAPNPPYGVRGRVRPVVRSPFSRIVREPILVREAHRSRPNLSAPRAGTGGQPLRHRDGRAVPLALTARPSEGDWLQAVGHSSRVTILRHLLATGTATPTDIASMLGLPLSTVAYHVRFLADRGIVRLAGRTQRRGAVAHHYQLTDRDRVASFVWGTRAELLVTDFERQNGRGDVTVRLDSQALSELRGLTDDYLARIGELGLQTRERDAGDGAPTQIAVLLATDAGASG